MQGSSKAAWINDSHFLGVNGLFYLYKPLCLSNFAPLHLCFLEQTLFYSMIYVIQPGERLDIAGLCNIDIGIFFECDNQVGLMVLTSKGLWICPATRVL